MAAVPTEMQVSAGGVAVRGAGAASEVVLVSVGERRRWQLPKGIVEAGETAEATALREVREEAGIATDLIAPLETIEYWYYAIHRGRRVRFHKFVHFFLLRYVSGDVADHDREVHEARWVPLGQALTLLAFKSERAVVVRAQALLGGRASEERADPQ